MYIFRKLLLMMLAISSLAQAEASSSDATSLKQYEDELKQLQSEKKHLYFLLGKEKYTKSNAPKVKVKKRKKEKKKRKYRGRHVDIRVDISQQLMRVSKDNRVLYTWPVSTGRKGHWTPRGTFKPKFIRERYRGNACNRSFMPHTIFFANNLAIYGTRSTRKLGQNVAYSCIAIANDNAKILYNLVKSYGKHRVTIRITR